MIVLKLSLVSGRRTFFGRGNEIHYIGGTEILEKEIAKLNLWGKFNER